MQIYRRPQQILGPLAGVLYHMHSVNAAEAEHIRSFINQHDIQNEDRPLRHVYSPTIDYNSDGMANVGLNPVPGDHGMNPSPSFTPITATHVSGYHIPGDDVFQSTPASHQHEEPTPQHTPDIGSSSWLYEVISSVLVSVATTAGLGVVVHMNITPELRRIFSEVRKRAAKGKDNEPAWVKGFPFASPGAAASSWEPAPPGPFGHAASAAHAT